MNMVDAFWLTIAIAVVSTLISAQQAKASNEVQENAANEAAQMRHRQLILAEEQAAVEQENSFRIAQLQNQQLENQAALISEDISLAELQATQAEMDRRKDAKRLAATNVAAFGGDPTSPSFRAFMAANDEVAKEDISTIRLNENAARFGLNSELEGVGLQQFENVLGAEFAATGAKLNLRSNQISAEAAAGGTAGGNGQRLSVTGLGKM